MSETLQVPGGEGRAVTLGAAPSHRSCAGNLEQALRSIGRDLVAVPQPVTTVVPPSANHWHFTTAG